MKILSIAFLFLVSGLHVFARKENVPARSTAWMKPLAIITKPLLLPALALFYLAFTKEPNLLLLTALAAGWLGDIALMFTEKYENETPFIVGLFFFLIGHLIYSILFFGISQPLFCTNIIFIVLFLPYLLYCLLLFSYIFNDQTQTAVKTGAIIYALALSVMSFAALSLLIFAPGLGTALIFCGSVFFVSSDSVLALKSDNLGRKADLSRQFILGSYMAAQALIITGYILTPSFA